MRILNSWYGFKSRIEVENGANFHKTPCKHKPISHIWLTARTFRFLLYFSTKCKYFSESRMVITAHAICILIIFNIKNSFMIRIQKTFIFFVSKMHTWIFYVQLILFVCNIELNVTWMHRVMISYMRKVCQKGSHLKSIESKAHTYTMYRSNQLNAHHTKSNGFGIRRIDISSTFEYVIDVYMSRDLNE